MCRPCLSESPATHRCCELFRAYLEGRALVHSRPPHRAHGRLKIYAVQTDATSGGMISINLSLPLAVFKEVKQERLDLHVLFEAAVNEPAEREQVLDAV